MKTPYDEARAFVNGFFGMVEKAPRGEAMVAQLAGMLTARDAEHARATAALVAAPAEPARPEPCGVCEGDGTVGPLPCPACKGRRP